jgi:hypothetical protein
MLNAPVFGGSLNLSNGLCFIVTKYKRRTFSNGSLNLSNGLRFIVTKYKRRTFSENMQPENSALVVSSSSFNFHLDDE